MAEDQRHERGSEPLDRLRRRIEAESNDSLRLLDNPLDNPICSLSLDQSVPCIAVIWKQYATSTQLRFIHEAILDLLQRHRITKILGDDSALPMIHAEDQSWITENWMPRAIVAGLRAAASKRSSSYFGKLSIANVRSGAPTGLTLRVFDDMAEARRWLRGITV
jgi:hypothetical protein